MVKAITVGLVAVLASFSSLAEESVVRVASQHSVQDTANKFVEIAQSKGLNVFARVNHQENAAKVDMALRPTEVIVFGNPKSGHAVDAMRSRSRDRFAAKSAGL